MTKAYKSKKDQIKDYIILEILQGNLAYGQRLNDIRFYTSKFKVSPNLIKEVISDLLRDDIIKVYDDHYQVNLDQARIDQLKNIYLNKYINDLLANSSKLGYSLGEIIDELNLRNMANG